MKTMRIIDRISMLSQRAEKAIVEFLDKLTDDIRKGRRETEKDKEGSDPNETA